MLKEILKIISRDGYLSRSQLAAELDTSTEIIDVGIEQLLRMGYLLEEDTGQSCSTVCTKCPFASNCNKDIVKTFQISEKGSKYLEK